MRNRRVHQGFRGCDGRGAGRLPCGPRACEAAAQASRRALQRRGAKCAWPAKRVKVVDVTRTPHRGGRGTSVKDYTAGALRAGCRPGLDRTASRNWTSAELTSRR